MYFMSNNPLNKNVPGGRHTFASSPSAILLSEVCLALKKSEKKLKRQDKLTKTEVM